MRLKLATLGIAWCLVGGVACAPSYIYRPVGRATVQVPILEGLDVPAAVYAVPGEGGTTIGEVRVAALGVRSLPDGAGRELGVRVAIENRSGDLWFVDVLHQLLISPSGRQQPPNHVHRPRGGEGSPLTAIEPHSSVQLEYFYPSLESSPSAPVRFSLAWSLWTPARVLAMRTSFARDENRGEGPVYAGDESHEFPYPDGPSPFATGTLPLGPSWAQRPPRVQPVAPPPSR